MVRAASASQFPGLKFGCSDNAYELQSGTSTTVNCGVISEGVSGQIRTECDAGASPYVSLPLLATLPPSPDFTCSAPTVSLVSGGWAIIPVTVLVSPDAPDNAWSSNAFLSLWSGTTMINADPFGINVAGGPDPDAPVNDNLTCEVVSQNAVTPTMTFNGATLTMNPRIRVMGTCTLTALDANNEVPTLVSAFSVANAGQSNGYDWDPEFGLTEAEVAELPTGSQPLFTVTLGSTPTSMWFSVFAPPNAAGSGPTSLTLQAQHQALPQPPPSPTSVQATVSFSV